MGGVAFLYAVAIGFVPAAQARPLCVKPSIDGMIAKIDHNHDGKLSHAEWRRERLPDSSFAMLSKGKGYVLPSIWRATAPPLGIDANGNCVITLAEFRAFDRKMRAKLSKYRKVGQDNVHRN